MTLGILHDKKNRCLKAILTDWSVRPKRCLIKFKDEFKWIDIAESGQKPYLFKIELDEKLNEQEIEVDVFKPDLKFEEGK